MRRHDVSAMDRRYRAIHWLSALGAAVLGMVALWSAHPSLPDWWRSARKSHADETQASGRESSASSRGTPLVAASDRLATTAGTDSTVSGRPLPLYLISTSPGRNAHDGTAQIGTSIANPQTYSAGTLLANGARIVEIHREHVVLSDGKRSAQLNIYVPNTQARSADALLQMGASQQPESVVATTREPITDFFRPTPLYDGELLRGYEVYPGRETGVFTQLGLQQGDVIVAVDDVALADPSNTMAIFARLLEGAALTATIQRGGRTDRIVLDGAVIAARTRHPANSAVTPSAQTM
jgi:general secretion pathway protein C